MDVKVADDDGCAGDVAPVITVTLPDASTTTPTVERVRYGVYRGVYVPAVSVGRYTARAVADGYGVADFVALVSGTTANAGMPTVDDVRDYDTAESLSSWTDEQIQGALDAETMDQFLRCRIPAAYGANLAEALKRRVVVNLQKRGHPLGMVQAQEGSSNTAYLATSDPEVRRLEGPYRKAVFA
jgi:hypothetical protein